MGEMANPSFLYEDLENWMANLPPKLRAVPFIYLAIPGSHDSMTATLSRKSKLAPDAEKPLRRLRFLGPLLRLVMARWGKTQGHSAAGQLKAGIRYFDLRLAMKKRSIFPYFVHGLYATEAPEMLNEVKDFVDTHPQEVVILDFNHFYAFETLDHKNFIKLLLATFQHRFVPYTVHIEHLTLDNMTRLKHQVIIVYRCHFAIKGQSSFWPGSDFPSPWPNTVSKRELIAKLNQGIANRPNNMAYISQFLLTPTNWFVSKHLFSTLKKQCAKPLRKLIRDWLGKQNIGTHGVNIVISDFVDLNANEFVKEVIALNAKALPDLAAGASSLTPVDSY